MPWEKGVFKKIFKKPESLLHNVFKQPRQWVGLDVVPEAETMDEFSSAVGSRHQLVGAFYEHALSSISDQSFLQERQNLLAAAVEKWFCIIRVNMLASSVGHDIIGLGNMEDQKKGAFQVIEAVIGVRSRTTAVTIRANALLKFLRWRADTSENDGKKFSELEAWSYLLELREKGAAPTKSTSFLSACAYALHVFKIVPQRDFLFSYASAFGSKPSLTACNSGRCCGGQKAAFRESDYVLASLQEQVSATDASTIKKVPVVERETKMKAIKKRLTGLLIEGPLEPRHALLDTAASMMQLNEIKYIPPEKCISRTHEVLNQKTPTKQLDILAENLIVKEKQDTPDMTVTSALQVQEAFQRRGIALVFADLITHENYTRYITTLFGHLHRDPPVGYARTSVSQLVAADRTVWQMLLKEGIQPKRDEMGTLSLDSKLMESLQSYRVSFALLPLIAKKDSTPSPLKTTKPAANQGGKGAHLQVQKPWLKTKGGKKGGKGKDALKQRMERNVDGVFIFVRNATVRMEVGFKDSFGVDHKLDKAEHQEVSLRSMRAIATAQPKASKMPPIVREHRLALFKEILVELEYPDVGAFDELVNGTDLVGEVKPFGIFEKAFRPAEKTVSQLKEASKSERMVNFYKCSSSGDQEIDTMVYSKTMEEVDCGWAMGPIPMEDLPSVKALNLIWSCFFDDYVVFSRDEHVNNTEQSVSLLFKLLGWKFAEEGDKADGFCREFGALCIRIILDEADKGLVKFTNTAKRSMELVDTINALLTKGSMTTLEAQRLRGRMQFMDGQLFGRLGKLCMREVTNHSCDSKTSRLSGRTMDALKRFTIFLEHAEPRLIHLSTDMVWHIYTDACYEPTSSDWQCGLGGVLVGPNGRQVAFFSVALNHEQLELLGSEIKKTIIFEAELLALVLAFSVWRDYIKAMSLICFVDNNSARDVAISGNGRNITANSLIEFLLKLEMSSCTTPWYARIPTPSNIADEPSRGVTQRFIQGRIPETSVCDGLQEILLALAEDTVMRGSSR
ncbi:unnamed protein product [Cladocopium goreaui]|uniref:C3H1-type domain-containing protein n=1 Tax=Cladocopium goreaui TaxID=2562237 RepID=A0A9P1CJ43_9DINO|nr:unnamed protein product [Cladocopium goreaui]